MPPPGFLSSNQNLPALCHFTTLSAILCRVKLGTITALLSRVNCTLCRRDRCDSPWQVK